MPPRAPLITDRLSRMEASLAALTEDMQQLRLFCLDIHPDFGRRIITTMHEMEQKVYLNVTTFESKVSDINNTVRSLVAQSANDCLALVQDAIGSKMSGLDSRMIGLNKKQAEMDKELSSTLHRLNEFSEAVERTLSHANEQALEQLRSHLKALVPSLLKEELLLLPDRDILAHRCNLATPVEPGQPHVHGTFCSLPNEQPRGRSRERFQLLQNQLVLRARSVSSERDLRLLISDARSVAAVERINEAN